MASVNRVILMGNIGRDPEVRHTTDGHAICNVSLATSRRMKDGKDETEWHRVVIFGKAAEVAERYLRKGSAIYVEGRIKTRKYTGKDGVERYQTEILSESFQMIGKAEGQAAAHEPAPAQAKPFANDDVPF